MDILGIRKELYQSRLLSYFIIQICDLFHHIRFKKIFYGKGL